MFGKRKKKPGPGSSASKSNSGKEAASSSNGGKSSSGVAANKSSSSAAASASASVPVPVASATGGGSSRALKGSRSKKGALSSSQTAISSKMDGMRLDESKNEKSFSSISYAAERIIGNGSFGVVYEAIVVETKHRVAIKKVLQDRRFKNRELQIMRELSHPNVVTLYHSFLAQGEKASDVFLNLVMEFIPETIHRTLRTHAKAKKLVNMTFVKVYMYQVCRSLAYIHSKGICHRDIKPQNLLLDSRSHRVKLCDFGSAKVLLKGKPNVAYICSRYYRAPELVFEATEYTTAIDVWSLGCVMSEMMLGKPLFPGESGVDQLIEIIKVLGTPTREEIKEMNPNHTTFTFPQISPHPWSKVFRHKVPSEAIDLVNGFLTYKPHKRLTAIEALAHPFFDELRQPNARLPSGKAFPPLFNFTDRELALLEKHNILNKVLPAHAREKVLANRGTGRPVDVVVDIFKMNPHPESARESSKQRHHRYHQRK